MGPSDLLAVSPTASLEEVRAAYLERTAALRSAFLHLGGFDESPHSSNQTFETFVAGSANHIALAACRRICEAPGSAFNPLFIHGRPGLGKTHLLSAMRTRLADAHRNLLIVTTTAERFTDELLLAMGSHSLDQFREKYRGVDVLMIDEFHQIGNRLRAQEELCAALDTLIASGHQIIIAGQAAPQDSRWLSPSLRSRLSCGLVTEVGYPDLEMRQAIVLQLAEQAGLGLSAESANTLARRVQHDVREIVGAVNRLVALRLGVSGSEIECRIPLDDLLYDLAPRPLAPQPSLEAVLDQVLSWYALEMGALKSRSREARVRRARQVALYLARTSTTASLQEIADALGATPNQVLYAVRAVERNLSDPLISGDLEAVRASLAQAKSAPRSKRPVTRSARR